MKEKGHRIDAKLKFIFLLKLLCTVIKYQITFRGQLWTK